MSENDQDQNSELKDMGDIVRMDGSSSHKSYLVFARQGSGPNAILLGVKLYGLLPGEQFNTENKTYLFCRIRSARSPEQAIQIDNILAEKGNNIVGMTDHRQKLADAWGNIEFEKIDDQRASLAIGIFLRGSITDNPGVVLDRLSDIDCYQLLAEEVVKQAGPEHCFKTATQIALWLRYKASPMLQGIGQHIKISEAQKQALTAFSEAHGDEVEIAGAHMLKLKNMMQKAHKEGISAFKEPNGDYEDKKINDPADEYDPLDPNA